MKVSQFENNQRIRITILIIAILTVSFIPHDLLFDESKIVCIHYYLFGFQCPLCGMTRAVYQLTHLQFASALNYNIVVALLPVYFISDIFSLFIRRNWLFSFKKNVFVLIFIGLFFLYLFRIAMHFEWI
ncbi:MAG: DUF2752 domain-containing protein [Prolixibacteraceae bacterium]